MLPEEGFIMVLIKSFTVKTALYTSQSPVCISQVYFSGCGTLFQRVGILKFLNFFYDWNEVNVLICGQLYGWYNKQDSFHNCCLCSFKNMMLKWSYAGTFHLLLEADIFEALVF